MTAPVLPRRRIGASAPPRLRWLAGLLRRASDRNIVQADDPAPRAAVRATLQPLVSHARPWNALVLTGIVRAPDSRRLRVQWSHRFRRIRSLGPGYRTRGSA